MAGTGCACTQGESGTKPPVDVGLAGVSLKAGLGWELFEFDFVDGLSPFPVGEGTIVSVTGQIVTETETVWVTSTVEWAGQLVTVGAQEVTVWTVVV